MSQLTSWTCFFISSVVAADIQGGDVRVYMPPPAKSLDHFPSRSRRLLSRRLDSREDFQKTSPNFFDLTNLRCEKMGPRHCDGAHYLGSGNEFASWNERTQHLYTNMARMDHQAFTKAYRAKYRCTPKNTHPLYWSSQLTQVSRFHSNQLAVFGSVSHPVSHDTPEENSDLFGGSVRWGERVMSFAITGPGIGENIIAGAGPGVTLRWIDRAHPLGAVVGWLASIEHCHNMLQEKYIFLGAGYAHVPDSLYKSYYTDVFGVLEGKSPTQDIVAGSHDDITGSNRFLVQVHMSQAPNKVSVVVGGTTKTMALLMGTAKSGTYYVDVDVDTLTGAKADGCVPYYFEVDSSRMPKDKSFHFLTFGVKNCKRNIGTSAAQPSGNVCTCPNGKPRTGATCTTNNAVMCASCDSGFTLRVTKCVKNTCLCPNGTPKATCPVDRAFFCESCKQKTGDAEDQLGYQLKKESNYRIKCIKKLPTTSSPNVCICPGGWPKVGRHCTRDKAVLCAVCNKKTHTLQNNNVCVKKSANTGPTTAAPTTAGPTTAAPTKAGPTTAAPTKAGPTTAAPTKAGPTTAAPTKAGPTTAAPTTTSQNNGGNDSDNMAPSTTASQTDDEATVDGVSQADVMVSIGGFCAALQMFLLQ